MLHLLIILTGMYNPSRHPVRISGKWNSKNIIFQFLKITFCQLIQIGAGYVVTGGSEYKGESLARKEKQWHISIFLCSVLRCFGSCVICSSFSYFGDCISHRLNIEGRDRLYIINFCHFFFSLTSLTYFPKQEFFIRIWLVWIIFDVRDSLSFTDATFKILLFLFGMI